METTPRDLIISSLGWFLAVILTIIFLTYGQSYYFQRGYNKGLAEQLEKDINKLEKNNFNVVPLSAIYNFNGTVAAVKDGKLLFDNTDRPLNPLLDPYPIRREVLIDGQTVILARTAKDGQTYSFELTQAGRKGTGALVLPYNEAVIDLAKLEPGQLVQVVARETESAYKTVFHADKIILNPNPPLGFNQSESSSGRR